MVHMNDQSFGRPEKDEIIIPATNGYLSPEIVGEFYKYIISLYSLIMSKHLSQIELLSSNMKRPSEF